MKSRGAVKGVHKIHCKLSEEYASEISATYAQCQASAQLRCYLGSNIEGCCHDAAHMKCNWDLHTALALVRGTRLLAFPKLFARSQHHWRRNPEEILADCSNSDAL